jgi:hypothetical protein
VQTILRCMSIAMRLVVTIAPAQRFGARNRDFRGRLFSFSTISKYRSFVLPRRAPRLHGPKSDPAKIIMPIGYEADRRSAPTPIKQLVAILPHCPAKRPRYGSRHAKVYVAVHKAGAAFTNRQPGLTRSWRSVLARSACWFRRYDLVVSRQDNTGGFNDHKLKKVRCRDH